MNGLALFAETPRAGELGHRFLVPVDLSISESEIAEFVQVADSDVSVGENFVAIGRNVPQHSAAGAVRVGREVVVLAGIDVSRVSSHEFALIVTSLQGCLNRLDQLVIGGIEWNRTAMGEVIVRRKELQEWLDDVQAVTVPVTEWRNGPRQRWAVTAPPVHTPQPPICMVTWRTSVPVLLALALGIAIGAAVDQEYLRRSKVSQPAKTPTSKGTISNSPKPHGGPISPPNNIPLNPASSSMGISDLLRNAVHAGKVDALVDILTLLPSSWNCVASTMARGSSAR